jgi:hypothetical protein
MSKVDAQRAMREAKYARNQASGLTRREAAAAGQAPEAPTAQAPRSTATQAVPAPPLATPDTSARCGHKSMNGRVCTREAAHSEKNHRYS